MANRIEWESFPELPEDQVDVEIVASDVGPDHVEIALTLSPHLSWLKVLRALDANGNEAGRVQVFDDQKGPDTMTVRYDELHRLELVKAKTFGVPTGMYFLQRFENVRGKRISFFWSRD